jgi:hypothetical protein
MPNLLKKEELRDKSDELEKVCGNVWTIAANDKLQNGKERAIYYRKRIR